MVIAYLEAELGAPLHEQRGELVGPILPDGSGLAQLPLRLRRLRHEQVQPAQPRLALAARLGVLELLGEGQGALEAAQALRELALGPVDRREVLRSSHGGWEVFAAAWDMMSWKGWGR